MRKAIPEHPTAARGWIDHVLLPLAIVLTVGGLIAATGTTWNLTRPLWFDEIMTAVIVRNPDVVHSMQAMAHAVDTNVPGLHLITRVFTRLVGGHGGWEMHLVSLGAAILGLIGIYDQGAAPVHPARGVGGDGGRLVAPHPRQRGLQREVLRPLVRADRLVRLCELNWADAPGSSARGRSSGRWRSWSA